MADDHDDRLQVTNLAGEDLGTVARWGSDHHATLEALCDHLNSRMATDVTAHAADGTLIPDAWTLDDVDLLARALATAPQQVRASLAAMLAVPHLIYPDLDPADCTGLTAGWCPRCGTCTCREGIVFEDPDCPLHAPSSTHAQQED